LALADMLILIPQSLPGSQHINISPSPSVY